LGKNILKTSDMNTPLPIFMRISSALCRFYSYIIAGIHYFAVRNRLLEIPGFIWEAPGGPYKNLQKIWFSRLLKKLVSLWVRSPLRNQALQLVKLDIPIPAGTGTIFVTCHTPWKRLLVNWFSENHYALIIDTGNSKQRTNRIKEKRKGYNELLHIIRHLQYGGRVIIAADVFNKSDNHPTEILGKPGNLSLLPARLARIAGVPLIAAVPQLQNGTIHIHAGPRYDDQILQSDMGTVMQNMLRFFEDEIKRDPSIWSYFVNDSLCRFHKKRIE
jgi:lauroyl/myristoyl acyltransferase